MSSSPDLLCRNTRRAIASTFRPPHYARNDYARNDAACENLQSRPKPIVACANPGLIQIKHRQGGIVLPCEGIMPCCFEQTGKHFSCPEPPTIRPSSIFATGVRLKF